MRSKLWLVAALFLVAGCKYDIWQFVAHPTVDTRVAESLEDTVAAPVVDPDSFRFAVISDLHFGSENPVRVPQFRAAVPGLGLSFFCVLGDVADHGLSEEYALAKATLDSIGLPYLTTIGNHDLYQASGWQDFQTTFGPSCYTVLVGNKLKLIFMDTADGAIGRRQFDWLEGQLNDDDRTVKMVLTHFPSYDGTDPIMWRLASATERYKLQYYLTTFDVKAYVAGHIHGWRHTTIGNVEHFISALAPGGMDYGTPGYVVFTFAHDSLSWERIEVQ